MDNSTNKNAIIFSNRVAEWLIAIATAIIICIFMMEYHRLWRWKPWSLLVGNECAAIAGTVCIALALLFGRFNSPRLLRMRRPLGVVGASVVCIHGLACLFFFEKFNLQYHLTHWVSLLLGLTALIGFVILLTLSFPWAIQRYGIVKWKRWQACGYLFLILGTIHFVVLGKIPAWLNWFRAYDRPAPPGTLIVFILVTFVVLLKIGGIIAKRCPVLLTLPRKKKTVT